MSTAQSAAQSRNAAIPGPLASGALAKRSSRACAIASHRDTIESSIPVGKQLSLKASRTQQSLPSGRPAASRSRSQRRRACCSSSGSSELPRDWAKSSGCLSCSIQSSRMLWNSGASQTSARGECPAICVPARPPTKAAPSRDRQRSGSGTMRQGRLPICTERSDQGSLPTVHPFCARNPPTPVRLRVGSVR